LRGQGIGCSLRERVGAFVAGISGVTSNPIPLDLIFLDQHIESLPEVCEFSAGVRDAV
jgi:hypothetical protein